MASVQEIQLELQRKLDSQNADGIIDDLTLAFYPLRFHPKQFLEALKERADKSGISSDEHNKNLMTLAILGTEEGQNLDRIKRQLSPERKRFLETAEKIYGLISTHHGGSAAPKSATLTRIAGCFVKEISLGIYNGTLQINTKVKPEMIAPGFPAFMCLSSFGSLIPTMLGFRVREVHNTVYDAWCFHQSVFDEIINRGKEKTPKYRILHFAERQHSSWFYSIQERINHCLTIGLLEVSDTGLVISDQYRSALNEAARKWRSLA